MIGRIAMVRPVNQSALCIPDVLSADRHQVAGLQGHVWRHLGIVSHQDGGTVGE